MPSLLAQVKRSRKEHPLKQIFKDNRVKTVDLSTFCGVSLSSMHAYLNGYSKTPEKVQKTLEALSAELTRKR